MSTSRPVARSDVVALLALLGVLLLPVMAGCGLAHGRTQLTAAIRLPRPKPSVLVVVLYRDSSTLVRTEFRTMVDDTARAGEHLIVIDADSGRELGSFRTPAVPPLAGPPVPPPLPSHPTSFQRAQHAKAAAAYQVAARTDLGKLHVRERRRLASWAAGVIVKIDEGNGVPLDTAGHSLRAAFDAAVADFASLGESRAMLGDRKVLAVLGFEGQKDSPPSVSAGLQQASVVVTSFPADPGAERIWRNGLLWEGAGNVVLLTRAASNEANAVATRDLDGAAPRRASTQP
jgi:hypothetical protein